MVEWTEYMDLAQAPVLPLAGCVTPGNHTLALSHNCLRLSWTRSRGLEPAPIRAHLREVPPGGSGFAHMAKCQRHCQGSCPSARPWERGGRAASAVEWKDGCPGALWQCAVH